MSNNLLAHPNNDFETWKEKLNYYSKWKELPPDPSYPWKNFDFYLTKLTKLSNDVAKEPLCPTGIFPQKPQGAFSTNLPGFLFEKYVSEQCRADFCALFTFNFKEAQENIASYWGKGKGTKFIFLL